MSHQTRKRSCSRSRQPKSLESLYITVQNSCSSLQNTLDGICKQCDSLQFESEHEHASEVLERLDAFESEVQLAMLSDAQCQLLAEDMDLNLSEITAIDVVKKLRDLELLRKNVSTFFKTLNKRFSSILDDGVYLYCVSLIEIAHEEIHEVTEYDEFISNQKLEISQSVGEIHHLEERWGNLTLDLHSTIDNLDGLQACLTDVQARWREIKEKIFAWLKQDRDYPNRLTGRISSNKESTQCLLLEMDVIDESEKRRAEECRYRQDQIKSLQKKRRELYNNLGHIQRAKRYNASKMAVNESESVQETERDKKSDPRKNSGGSKSQNEFHRRRDARLEKEQSDVKASIANVNKKINELKKMIEEEEDKKNASLRRINEIHIEIAIMEKTSVDCREILLQRGKVQTFIQLRKGALAKPTKGEVSFEEACRFVARRVRHGWPRLYLHLPMWPIRNHDQRLEDINGLLGYERMNVVLPRNRTPIEDAAAALAKWRLLSRQYIDVEGLVTGLRKAGWFKLANEVRKRFVQEVPQEEELSEKCEQEFVSKSEVVVIEEPESSEFASSQLNETSTYEETSKETEEVAVSERREGEEEEVRKAYISHENEEESANSEAETEANDDNKIECDKFEIMQNNYENQECTTDDGNSQSTLTNESIKPGSVNGDLSEENVSEEEGEKKDESVEEMQDAELVEMKEESKELKEINHSMKSEKKDKSATSSRKNSVDSNGSKEEDKSKKKDSKYDISNSFDRNDSGEQISKDDNVADKYETDASEIEKEEKNTSRQSSVELNSKVESVLLGISQKSLGNPPSKLLKDDNNTQEDKKKENLRKDSKSENAVLASEKEEASKNNYSSSENGKSDIVGERTSANSKNFSHKNPPNIPPKENEIDIRDGAKGNKNKEPVCTGEKAEDKMLKNKTDKTKSKPKGTISETADSKSRPKANDKAKKEEKPKSNRASKLEPEVENEDADNIDKKEDNKIKILQEKGDREEIVSKNSSEDAESKLSGDTHKLEETASGGTKNEDKMTDREIEELSNNGEEGGQNPDNNDDGYKEVKEIQEFESNNKVKKTKPKEKETKKPPSNVKSTENSIDKKENRKAGRKMKADKSGKTKDKKNK